MDKWDKKITEHCRELEEEPKEGHFDRFGEKLRLSDPGKKRSYFPAFLKVSAVLIIILLSANLVMHLQHPKPGLIEAPNSNNDIGEATIYYTRKINNGIRDLEKMAGEGIGSKQEIIQIKHELSVMDSLFVNLQQEYKTNPNDERIINAMIEYYQTKLEIVNTIKTDLENVKQLKRKNHESPEI
jgi:hypothetical protein